MAGEYQLAQTLIDDGMNRAREDRRMDEDTLARALMYQLIEHNKKSRTSKDIMGELEQHIRYFEDDGDSVITRGS